MGLPPRATCASRSIRAFKDRHGAMVFQVHVPLLDPRPSTGALVADYSHRRAAAPLRAHRGDAPPRRSR
jgi:hypothetical protein